MFGKKSLVLLFSVSLILATVAAQCRPAPEPEVVEKVVKETVVVKEEVVKEVEVTKEVVVTPTPAPPEEVGQTVVVCQGQEPDTLYIWGGAMLAASHIQEAVYDSTIGPPYGFDQRSFDYQLNIVEKLPSLADGDAVISTVTAEEGDTVVNDVDVPREIAHLTFRAVRLKIRLDSCPRMNLLPCFLNITSDGRAAVSTGEDSELIPRVRRLD